MRRLALLATAGLALAMAGGCSSSPEDTRREAAEGALSWAAGARMTAEAWSARRVTSAFARAGLEAAQRGLEQERARLGAAPRALADARGAVDADAIATLSVLVARMQQAVERGDGAGLAALETELAAAARGLQPSTRGAGT